MAVQVPIELKALADTLSILMLERVSSATVFKQEFPEGRKRKKKAPALYYMDRDGPEG